MDATTGFASQRTRTSSIVPVLSLGLIARCSGLLGMVTLSYAPTYGAYTDGGRNFSVPFAVVGTVLVAVWLLYRLAHLRGWRIHVLTCDLPAKRISTLRYWQALTLCSLTFTMLWLGRAPVRLSAVFATATVVTGVCLFTNLSALSLALLARDRSRPLHAVRWLALVPSSLVGLTLGLLLAGDSWVTLPFGCVAACLGPLLAGSDQGDQL